MKQEFIIYISFVYYLSQYFKHVHLNIIVYFYLYFYQTSVK